MQRVAIVMLAALLFACKEKKPATPNKPEPQPEAEYQQFSGRFKTAPLPYQLADTELLQNKDTAAYYGTALAVWIPDSIKNLVSEKTGKENKTKFIPLAKVENPKSGTFFVIKAESSRHKAAILLSFDKKQHFGAALPFLIPDTDPGTTQVSTIDKAFSITRSVFRKQPNDVIAEGKDVY